MGSASKRERSPKGKFPADCAETPITSSKKETTQQGWFSFWNCNGRESEGGELKPRWGFGPPLGSASKRERRPKGKFPADCAKTPITSSKKETTQQGWFSFWNCNGRESEPRIENCPVDSFPRPG